MRYFQERKILKNIYLRSGLGAQFIILVQSMIQALSDRNFIDPSTKTHKFLPQNPELFQDVIRTTNNYFEQLLKAQEKLKKSLLFWNSMADGKLESFSSCINLFILLLILTLGSAVYNGEQTKGPQVLGWICIGQVCFFYLLIVLIKFFYIPAIEEEFELYPYQSLSIFNSIQSGNTQLKSLDFNKLNLLLESISLYPEVFSNCFSNASLQIALISIKSALNLTQNPTQTQAFEIKKLIHKEKIAKRWQNFWQVFILGKTFTIPGVLLLVFIITPLSIATPSKTSVQMNNAQGWLAVGFLGGGFLLFCIIKLFIWDFLDKEVENSKAEVFILYQSMRMRHQPLMSFNLHQLEELQLVLINRANQFKTCFPNEDIEKLLSDVKNAIKQKLPKRQSQLEENPIHEIIQKQKALKNLSAAWTSFFNARLISTIINVLKFLIVMAITFAYNYTDTQTGLNNAKIVIGSVGIGYFVFGYLLYIFLRAYYLNHLQELVLKERSSPFTTFRLVYFGYKTLNDCQVHQLEDISSGINTRSTQFSSCFPNCDQAAVDQDIKRIIRIRKISDFNSDNIFQLLKQQSQARKMLAFWTGYIDNPFLTSMYSVFVLLVLLVVSITSVYGNAPEVMGWIGVGNAALIILMVLFFKVYLIQYMTNTVKTLKVQGYSEYNLVYANSKKIQDLQLSELTKIQHIMESNPIQFRKCFPKSQFQQTLTKIKRIIFEKNEERNNIRRLSASQEIEYQTLALQLNRCKNALSAWTNLIVEKIYAIASLSTVIYILWAQSIATDLYGITVCGFLTVAKLSLILLLVGFYYFYYRGHLQETISKCQKQIRVFRNKELEK